MNGQESAQSLGQILLSEAQGLRDISFGPEVLSLVLALVLVGVLQLSLRGLLGRWGRSQTRRDMANVLRFATRIAAWVLVVSLVVHRLFTVAPLLATGTVVLGVSGLAFGVGLRAQDWLLGWAVVLRGLVRVGDHLELGSAQGVVERLGLLRVSLTAVDGTRVLLPTRALTQDSLRLSTPHQTVPVDVLLRPSGAITTDTLRRVRHIAGLCPYRSWVAEPAVDVDGERVRVRLQAWSPGAAIAADAYLRESLDREPSTRARSRRR